MLKHCENTQYLLVTSYRSRINGKKSKCYEPISKIKKNQIVLELDRVYWKGKVFDWFNKLSIEDRVIACKTIDKNLTSESIFSL